MVTFLGRRIFGGLITVYLLSCILSGLLVVDSDGLCVVTEGCTVDTLVDDFVVVLIGI